MCFLWGQKNATPSRQAMKLKPPSKLALKKIDGFVGKGFHKVNPTKPCPACGWLRSKKRGEMWVFPYNQVFGVAKPLKLKVVRRSAFTRCENFDSIKPCFYLSGVVY